jgi:hypothetical protein
MHRQRAQRELPVVLEPGSADEGFVIFVNIHTKGKQGKEECQRTVVKCGNVYVKFYDCMNE